jgi:hypothetical protein
MIAVGLDLNATRVRAVTGAEGLPPQVLSLDENVEDLPVAISIQRRQPEVGRNGTSILREWPHLVCHDFLTSIGKPRVWSAGRHRLDALKALALVYDHLRTKLGSARAGALALPAYLTADQCTQVLALAQKSRLPVLGATCIPLAAGLAAHAAKPWNGAALVLDVDDHAFTWTRLRASADKLQVADGKTLPHLGLHAWKMRLLDSIAEKCVRHSRRDPRDSGSAEQLLFDQIDGVIDAADQAQLVEVVVRTDTWCQNLFLQPDQVAEFCAAAVEDAAREIGSAFASATPEVLSGVWLTANVGRLPGLTPAIREIVGDSIPVTTLPADAAAVTAWELAFRMHRGELPHVHSDVTLPLPKETKPKGVMSFLKIPTFSAER